MAKTLLRSGNLDDYQAVGGGGQAVFDSALQIRETLRLRKQQAMADCLAIPQVNDSGDRVDWYSPSKAHPSRGKPPMKRLAFAPCATFPRRWKAPHR